MRVASHSRFSSLAAILAASLFGGCATDDRIDAGHLVIIGGGLKEDHAAVYRAFLDVGGPGATVGVLPTASGVYRESGPRAVERIDRHAGLNVAEVIDVTMDNPEAAADPDIAAQIARHRVIYFTGGDQSRTLDAFRPAGGDTVGYQALLDVLARGGVIAGTSAGAAMMSDPSIRGGRSAAALLHGATHVIDGDDEGDGVLIGRGMGFFPYGITGQHFLTRGRMGRMIVALEATGVRRGFGVNDNTAIHVDLATHAITAIGERGLLVIDMEDAERDGDDLTGVRVSLLGDGDRIDGVTGEVTPAPGKDRLVHASDVHIGAEWGDVTGAWEKPPPPLDAGDVWERDRAPALITKLAMDPRDRVIGSDGVHEVHFIADSATSFYRDPADDLMSLTAVGVRVDVIRRVESPTP